MTTAIQSKTMYIYLSSTQSDATKGIFKVGETDCVARRMGELSGTAHYEKYTAHKTWKNAKYTDKQIHAILTKKGIDRVNKNREFFDFGTLEKAIRTVNDILLGTHKLNDFSEREEQTRIIGEVCKNFESNINENKKHLVDAKMRAGKCHISYKIASRMGFKRVLILSSKPSGVCDSWRNDVDHIAFADFDFRSAHELSDVCFSKTRKTQVIFVSTQDCIGDGGNKKKFETLFGQKFDLLILDESHHGCNTEKLNNFLENLNFGYELRLSGTAFKDKRSGKFKAHQISTWTYVQEQAARKLEESKGWKTTQYRGLPTFKGYICAHDHKVINAFQKQYGKEEMVTNRKLFEDSKLTKDFLAWVVIDKQMGKLITDHMFWLLPGVAHCDNVEKALKANPCWQHYEIVNASGDNITDLTSTKNSIYNKKAKTITLSCGRWNTGSTVPQWDSVWMLDDGYSSETFFQTIARAGTPFVVEGNFRKPDVHFVDFNSDRVLRCFMEYASCYKPQNSTVVATARTLLDCMPLYRVSGVGIEPLDYDALSEHFNGEQFSNNMFGALSLLNLEKLDEDIKDILRSIEEGDTSDQAIALNANSLGRGKNHKVVAKQKTAGVGGKPSKEDLHWQEKAKTVLRRFASLLFVLDNIVVSDVRDLKFHKDKFEMYVGISFADFLTMLDSGFIDEDKLNDNLCKYNIQNEFLFT